MKEKMENPGVTLVTLSSSVVIPSSIYMHIPRLDYSEYFEPTDTIKHTLANSESVAGSLPDFSDYFEPIANDTRSLRVSLE